MPQYTSSQPEQIYRKPGMNINDIPGAQPKSFGIYADPQRVAGMGSGN